MRKFCRMTLWAINAYHYGRNKPHGVRYPRRTALFIALQGWHIGMGKIGWYTDPTYWLLRKSRHLAP
jgi:hypothetical protein